MSKQDELMKIAGFAEYVVRLLGEDVALLLCKSIVVAAESESLEYRLLKWLDKHMERYEEE